MNAAPHELPMFAEGVVGFGDAPDCAPYLIGGRCPACGRWYFPQPDLCRHCQAALERASLGSRGEIYSNTVVRTKPPLGLPRPYAVGYIDLAEQPLRIFMLLDPSATDTLRIGQQVELAVGPLGVNRERVPCLRPFFRPIATG